MLHSGEPGFQRKEEGSLVKEEKQRLFKHSGITWRLGYYSGKVIIVDFSKPFTQEGHSRTTIYLP
jgi:hypothetical protein